MVQFGDRLRELRLSRQITQKELGKMFQLSESAIGMYERNQREPSLELVKQFADFFRVSTGYMLDHPDSRPSVREPDTRYFMTGDTPMLWTGTKRYKLTKDETVYLVDSLESYRQIGKIDS